MWPRYEESDKDFHLCIECGFAEGKISEDKYLSYNGINLKNAHAAVNDKGEAVIWIGPKTPPWKITNKQERKNPKYKEWRNSVFVRDDYTCQKCGKRGGDLNAHHIKPFSTHINLRFEVSNGLTLCSKCHKHVHKKLG
nr:HNH endonuclease [Evansella tamaricis]